MILCFWRPEKGEKPQAFAAETDDPEVALASVQKHLCANAASYGASSIRSKLGPVLALLTGSKRA